VQQSRSLATAVSAVFTTLALSRHATILSYDTDKERNHNPDEKWVFLRVHNDNKNLSFYIDLHCLKVNKASSRQEAGGKQASYLLGLPFASEDGDITFLRNAGELPYYIASYARIQYV
jgi:hypothetical protein